MELSLPMLQDLWTEIRRDGGTLLHLHGIFNLCTYSIALRFGGNVPVATQSHDPIYSTHENFSWIRNSFRKYALRNVDRFYLSSETESAVFGGVCDPRKICLSPVPIDMSIFRRTDKAMAKRRLGWRANDGYVLYVGRLEERKGFQYLVEALHMLASRYPRVHLVAVGYGSLSTESTDDIIFVGRARYFDLSMYYNAADICVLPSLGETWGRVVLESLACGTPVIATPTGCVPTLVNDGVPGLFTVPMRDSGALADSISRILPQSEALRGRMDMRKLEKYDSENFVERLLLDYKELAAEHRVSSGMLQ